MRKTELTRITREVYRQYKPEFAGYCARASVELARRLLEAGANHLELFLLVSEKKDTGISHVYVRYQDYYLDPTQEQFGRRGVWMSTEKPPMGAGWRVRGVIPVGLHFDDQVWSWFGSWRAKYRPTMRSAAAVVSLVRKQKRQKLTDAMNKLNAVWRRRRG